MKYATNKKLNGVFNCIEEQLLEMCDTPEESINQIKDYMAEFKKEPDYGIAMQGNLLVYYPDIHDMYGKFGYPSAHKVSDCEIWSEYCHQVGYVARAIIRNYNN